MVKRESRPADAEGADYVGSRQAGECCLNRHSGSARSMQKTILTLCLISIGLGAVVSAYANSSQAQLANSGVVTDWVVKDICANASNQPVPADPYYTCPAGTKRRKIQPGDPLPYYNFDQGGTQGAEAYPLLDAQGNPLYVHAIENSPYNQFHLIGDGYDFYSVDSQWLSIPGTRDNGGYGTQFFGANCSYNDGWISFQHMTSCGAVMRPQRFPVDIGSRIFPPILVHVRRITSIQLHIGSSRRTCRSAGLKEIQSS